MSNKILDAVRGFVSREFETGGYYVYNITRNKIAWAQEGKKFCDHWESLDNQPEIKAFVAPLFPKAEPKAPKAKAVAKPAKKPMAKAAAPKAVKAGAWTVEGGVAKSPKGRAWKAEACDLGWYVTSKSGCKGLLTKAGAWMAR